jgi:hypothetical protein
VDVVRDNHGRKDCNGSHQLYCSDLRWNDSLRIHAVLPSLSQSTRRFALADFAADCSGRANNAQGPMRRQRRRFDHLRCRHSEWSGKQREPSPRTEDRIAVNCILIVPTLLAIDTHSGVQDFLPQMWPHYERAGVDIVGIERTNRSTRFPKDIPVIAVGEDLFTRWCQHRHPTLLCNRMLDTVEALLTRPEFEKYTDFCASTWSVLFTKPLPQPMPGGLVLWQAGGAYSDPGLTAPYFFHHPRWFNRPTGEKILKTGRALIAAGRTESGADDFFLGLIVSEAKLGWIQPPAGHTTNALDTPETMASARRAIADGAWWVGNVKNERELAALWPAKTMS